MELTIEEALRKGVEAHRAGNAVEADKYYTAILGSQPNHPDANHNMGVLAVGVGKVEEALPFFKKALDANATVEQFWLSYIDALIKLNRQDDARTALGEARASGRMGDKLIQLEAKLGSTGNVNVSLQQGISELVALYKTGKLSETLELGLALSEDYTDSFELSNILGAVYLGLNEYEKAIIHYNNAKNLQPLKPAPYSNLGIVFKEMGRYEDAIKNYKKDCCNLNVS